MVKGTAKLAKGMQESLMQSNEVKKDSSLEGKKLGSKEDKKKRSYALKLSTIKKLDELKTFKYPIGTSLEDIVDDAICKYYEVKQNE